MNALRFTILNNSIRSLSLKDFSTLPKAAKGNELIISCYNKKLNFYKDQTYSNFDNVPLASKGWNHNRSHGDHFTIHPNIEDYDQPNIQFQDINVNPKLIEVLNTEGISRATTFQSQAIPVVKSGRHTVLAAETGCGKTIAYLLPILENLIGMTCEELNTPRALIIVPNRELAHQIGGVSKVLADAVGMKVKVVTGGRTKKLMLNPEFSDIDLLIGTPGAISKLSTVGIYKLNKVLHTVFDEADTLLDDSFLDRVETLTRRVSQSQIIFTSATMPRKFPEFFEPITQDMQYVTSSKLHKPLLNVTQKFIRLTRTSRPNYLLEIAKSTKSPLLIFSNKNATCDWIAFFLKEHNVKCANINGAMNYYIRLEQWQQFLRGNVNVLSATDVGSRGLDTTQVKEVLNYDFPLYASDYIHRVGRVGRLGSVPDSRITNFVAGAIEVKLVQEIETAIRMNTEIPNVDANIKAILQKKMLKSMRGTA